MPTSRPAITTIFLLFASFVSLGGQQKTLSPEARRLTGALAQLQKTPDEPSAQERYLGAFPHNYKSFLDLFDTDRELADGFDFIMILPSLAKNHETEVGRLLVQLSKDAHWNADAPNHLEQATVVYGGEHPKTFAALLQQVSVAERANLMTFLAHAENYAAYPEYQTLIDHLRENGLDDLAKEFELAREISRRRPAP